MNKQAVMRVCIDEAQGNTRGSASPEASTKTFHSRSLNMKGTPGNERLRDYNTKAVICHHASTPPPSPELAVIVRSFASILLGQAVADGEVYAAEIQRIERI
jgi:hypothetical protein